jgi:hypothetical protein
MDKIAVCLELDGIIKTIRLDRRKNLKGVKIMICEHNWKYKKKVNDSNLFVDWDNTDIT